MSTRRMLTAMFLGLGLLACSASYAIAGGVSATAIVGCSGKVPASSGLTFFLNEHFPGYDYPVVVAYSDCSRGQGCMDPQTGQLEFSQVWDYGTYSYVRLPNGIYSISSFDYTGKYEPAESEKVEFIGQDVDVGTIALNLTPVALYTVSRQEALDGQILSVPYRLVLPAVEECPGYKSTHTNVQVHGIVSTGLTPTNRWTQFQVGRSAFSPTPTRFTLRNVETDGSQEIYIPADVSGCCIFLQLEVTAWDRKHPAMSMYEPLANAFVSIEVISTPSTGPATIVSKPLSRGEFLKLIHNKHNAQ